MKVLYTILHNAFAGWMLYLGIVEQIAICWWIFVVIQLVVGLVLSLSWSTTTMEAVRREMNPKALEYKAIYRPISFAADTAIIIALVMYGHYLMAVWVLYTVSCLIHAWQELDRPC